MSLAIASVVRRHLKPTGRYVEARTGEASPIPEEKLPVGEHLLGWYRNPEPFSDDVIGFTERSIIHHDDEGDVTVIPFQQIVAFDYPKTKAAIMAVLLKREHGKAHRLRIGGGTGEGERFSDALRFVMVLRAIMQSLGRTPGSS